jgi:hypothetical protein
MSSCTLKKRLCNNESCENCFIRSLASIPNSKFLVTGYGKKTARQISRNDIRKIYDFKCDTCKHIFTLSPSKVKDTGNICPYCAVPSKLLCENETCNFCYNRSLASIERIVRCWSSTETKPRNYLKSTKFEIELICDNEICKHKFISSPLNLTSQNPTWCPYCCVPAKKLCDDENCLQCFERSFASHPLSKQWNEEENKISARKIFKHTNTDFKFNCIVCKKIYTANPHHIYGDTCLCCSNTSKILCNDENCNNCFKRSFANHPKVLQWSKTNTKSPREVCQGTHEKYEFDCEKCLRSFPASIQNVSRGTWCPFCKNKTEGKLLDFLKLGFSVKPQPKFLWCKKKNNLPFDFEVVDKNILIELDGRQHFETVWEDCNIVFENDIFKMRCANENGYSVIRILQEDVWFDRYDWKSELLKVIQQYSYPNNIYLCKNDEYNIHK